MQSPRMVMDADHWAYHYSPNPSACPSDVVARACGAPAKVSAAMAIAKNPANVLLTSLSFLVNSVDGRTKCTALRPKKGET
jgi:hypothetical protein